MHLWIHGDDLIPARTNKYPIWRFRSVEYKLAVYDHTNLAEPLTYSDALDILQAIELKLHLDGYYPLRGEVSGPAYCVAGQRIPLGFPKLYAPTVGDEDEGQRLAR